MASPNISFDTLPSSIRKPGKYFEFNTKLAVRTLAANAQKLLLIGQRLTSGSLAAGVLTNVFSDVEAATYFGRGSILHLMAQAAITAYPYAQVSAIALDDAAGNAATGTITIAGTATAAGALTLWVGNDRVDIPISSGDTAAVVAAALNAQLAKQPDLPVSAGVAGAVVTLTAKNKGTLGNSIKLSTVLQLAAGITSTVAAMSGGTTDPDIQSALTAVYTAGHTIICSSLTDSANLTKLRTHLDAVGGSIEQRGAVGVYALTSTLAAATTLASAINSGRITGCLAPSTQSLPWEVAAAYAAVIASEEDPARPLNTLALTGIAVIPFANRLSRTEQENALYNGVTPLEVGPGDIVQIVRAISTYTLDPQGIPDISLLDITTIRTLDYVRKSIRERIALRFPREKLSEKTPPKVRSQILDVLYKLEELEIVEAVEANKDGVICERDSQDPNRLNAKIPTDVVNGLHVFAGRIDLLL
ncbi:phage tail sheath subtilisin-like domain-containing protein [Leeia sp. TBRC 13508]|uniref:Phage tail sheath subtilisin-like domain-containing protein n=1 Tax=Leeia speluncae TaxID=2884804 RepID=A0ABS8D3S8_9NEIS|nr:phage tail sheath C-terminal domain-containing protein [Leeia speluncae]MCB6182313.1 phage tail sheath subtilisin-like domain-containing protein [Leeia speluncae]